jgi:hypothetical protein
MLSEMGIPKQNIVNGFHSSYSLQILPWAKKSGKFQIACKSPKKGGQD